MIKNILLYGIGMASVMFAAPALAQYVPYQEPYKPYDQPYTQVYKPQDNTGDAQRRNDEWQREQHERTQEKPVPREQCGAYGCSYSDRQGW